MCLLHRIRKLGRLNEEIDEELRFHLEEKERKLIADGLSPAAARREARKAFGSQAAVREHTRDAWIFRWADDLWRDLRFAARGLRRSPGFTAVVMITLALGIGANATIFSFVNALLLRDLPVERPEELVWFGVDDENGDWRVSQSYRLTELFEEEGTFADVAGVDPSFTGLTIEDSTELIITDFVTPGYFSVLGVRPTFGRLLAEEDYSGANGRVAVLGHDFWQDRFGGDSAIVGRSIILQGQPFVVVGVAVDGFVGTDTSRPAQVWLTADQATIFRQGADWKSADSNWLRIVARLRPGKSIEQSQAAASVVYRRFAEERLAAGDDEQRAHLENRFAAQHVRLRPVTAVNPEARDAQRDRFAPLAAAAGLILLICCANVANLLLGRITKRRHEVGIRLATGATRSRLVQQLVAEGVLLASLSGVAAVGMAMAASLYLLQAGITGGAMADTSLDGNLVAFTMGVSGLCVVLAAVYPAVSASRTPLYSVLRGGSGAVGERRDSLASRGWLIAAQFALCLPLLVGAGLLLQTVNNLYSQDVGFERSQRVHANVSLFPGGYGGDRALNFLNDLLSALQSQEGISSVGLSMFGTLGSSSADREVPVRQPDGTDRPVKVAWSYVSEGYFGTLDIPLLSGRDFRKTDDAAAPNVAIVNQIFAQRYLLDGNPVGQRIGDAEIVGVVADSMYSGLRNAPPPQMFYPFRQSKLGYPIMQIYARTDRDLAGFSSALRDHVSRLAPFILVDGIRTMDQVIEDGMREEQLTSRLLAALGVLALVVTAIGLYGVISFDVTRRTQEVGLRKALGAQTTDIFAMVFRRAAPWVIGGCVVGLAGAAAMTRLLEAKLFGVAALDPLTFALAAAFLLLCAAAANYLPARRAASVEPMTALRHD